MMKPAPYHPVVRLVVVVVIGLAACGHDPTAPRGKAMIVLRNEYPVAFSSIYVESCTDPVASTTNMLGVRERLLPNGEYSIPRDSGCYDLQVSDSTGKTNDGRGNINVGWADSAIVVFEPPKPAGG